MISLFRARSSLCNLLVDNHPLPESESTRQLKKPSTQIRRFLVKQKTQPKTGDVSRHYLTLEYNSSYLKELRNMVGSNSSGHFDHPDLHVSRIKKDVADVRALEGLMENTWINPRNHG